MCVLIGRHPERDSRPRSPGWYRKAGLMTPTTRQELFEGNGPPDDRGIGPELPRFQREWTQDDDISRPTSFSPS